MVGTKGIRAAGIIAALVLVILGVVMIAKPIAVAVLFDWFIGVLLLVGGISQIFTAFAARKQEGSFIGRLIAGIAIAALGVFVVVHENTSMFIMGMIIAIFAFALAFNQISGAFSLKKSGSPWGAAMFFGIVHLLFGAFMIYNCFAMLAAIIVINGIYLIVAGIMMFATSVFIKTKN